MGPPPFGDGNPTMRPPLPPFRATLQWGHRLSAMEMSSMSASTSVWALLQWGHRLSAMEIINSPQNNDVAYELQWGHRLSAMEMMPVFNHAPCVPVLQWGHRLSAMEISKPASLRHAGGSCFNGATAFRRWKCVGCTCLRAWLVRFNGATAFRRWKWNV